MHPDFKNTFRVTTDASGHAVSAVLTQEKDGIDLPVSYFLKTLIGASVVTSPIGKSSGKSNTQ